MRGRDPAAAAGEGVGDPPARGGGTEGRDPPADLRTGGLARGKRVRGKAGAKAGGAGLEPGRRLTLAVSRSPFVILAIVALLAAAGFVAHVYRLGRLQHDAAAALTGAVGLTTERAPDGRAAAPAAGALAIGRGTRPAAGDAGAARLRTPAYRPPPSEAASCSVHGMRDGEANSRAPLVPVRRYVVSLDKKPADRWREVARDFAGRLSSEVAAYLDSVIAEVALTVGVRPAEMRERVRQALARHRRRRILPPSRLERPGASSGAAGRVLPGAFVGGLFYDREELESFAKHSGTAVEDIALLQLAYEAAARCTSVVAATAGGKLVHGRTLDWDAPFLRAMTIEVEFRRGGEVVYVASTWAGYLGVLTGLRPNGFSVSVNWRKSAVGLLENFHHLGSGVWAAGCLVRHVLEADAAFPQYADAVRALASFPLASPAYVIVAGTTLSEGVVLTRGRRASLNPLRLISAGDEAVAAASAPSNFHGELVADQASAPDVQEMARALVQTNTDHWVDAAASGDVRRVFVSSYLENEERDYRLNRIGDLWSLLTTAPVFGESTLYATIMSPSTCLMETRRRQL